MYSFVARQPILNQHLQTVAYELLFRMDVTNRFPDVSPEFATAQLISDQFLTNPLTRSVVEQPYYINFPHQMLINGQAEVLPQEKVVIEILENSIPNNDLFAAVKKLKRKGFKIALDDFSMDSEWDRFLPYVDIIKFDLTLSTFSDIDNFIKRAMQRKLIYLAEKVETHEQYLQSKKLGISLFQGYFFSRPEMIKSKKLVSNSSNTVRLLREVNKPELNYATIEELVCADLSLYYKLMRHITNIKYNTRFGITATSMSFRSMAMLLGQHELKRFVSLISITNSNENKPCELYRTSLIRARFFELLYAYFNVKEDTTEAFLCGLLSLIDAVLDSPMPLLLSQIALSEKINQSLLNHTGELAVYLTLITKYEQQEWEVLEQLLPQLGLDREDFFAMVMEATQWADEIL
ncbi:EAL domain-containing protein [Pectobacterium brasiliense]|uniref:EAL domain-containing protein n=1 Tax=Pectobacterium brasiliense TaxID=180957 RepID=A0AAE2WE76_9GAMM|nr:EAL domain-containing protein [Pectobacterium brasiliense]MBA0216712.1 EAL domain-containing protein [Pectobacterium brasiliense]MBN3051633.1 EAL domain-containing protein [Pectobacterium brasiliense]MBN3073377.1 EAL domain-containing protein [Pectobacterium brasiliense]MBN3169091.1 EAL domain-containing protein [Pectobacterium brasiliense]